MKFKNVGKYLQELRIEKGISQQELADILKIHFQQVSQIERGVCFVPKRSWKALFKTYNLKYDNLLRYGIKHNLEKDLDENFKKTYKIFL